MDETVADILIQILILVVLVFLNAFFASSEMALVSLNSSKLKKMAEQGNKKAKRVLKITDNPSRFFATIQVGVTLSGFLASASASQSFADMLANGLSTFLPFGKSAINTISLIIITILISFITLVFGELVPKRIAVIKAERLSFSFSAPLSWLNTVMRPVISLLAATTNGILKLLGFDTKQSDDTVTEEEIRLMVDVGEEAGTIEENQKDMINNIFEFDDRTVDEIMTHRTEITAVDENSTVEEVVAIAISEGYSRIPAYTDDIDTISGIIYVKDLLKYVGKSTTKKSVKSIIRPAVYVPEAKSCKDLFSELTKKKIQMAIVVDEYGGTAGLVTMEDLVESILGDIQDEYDNEEEEIVEVNETTFTIDGTTDIIEVERQLDFSMPEGDYETIGGFMLLNLGDIPKADEHPSIELNGYSFTVKESDEKRIISVLVEKLPESSDDEDEKSKGKDK